MARAMASSSASLILRTSSLRSLSMRSASVSPDSLGLSLPSALAYQFRSRPCCHRPTGALRLWPR